MVERVVGLDFDNTIACYDAVFPAVARRLELIPDDLPASKTAVRDHLRRVGREDDWTWLQGHVYGTCMAEVPPFDGVIDCLRAWSAAGLVVVIISHKTAVPVRGPAHDLHAAARDWLAQRGFHAAAGANLGADRVYFEPTKAAKLARIAALGCHSFVDDLPEFLAEPDFPRGVRPVLFDPTGTLPAPIGGLAARSWSSLLELLLA